jgi:hypothetical protein
MNSISHWTLSYEEKCSDTFTVPRGRMFIAKLTRAAMLSAGIQPREPDAVALQIEVRRPGETEFSAVACTPWLTEPDMSAEVSLPAEPVLPSGTPDQIGPICRLRLLHQGRLMPHCSIQANT